MASFRKHVIVGVTAFALGGMIAASVSPANAAGGFNAALFGGLAAGTIIAGALAANNAYAAPVYGYQRQCWIESRPLYDEDGYVVRYRRVSVCN